MPQGSYAVVFPQVKWYVAAANETVYLPGGKTAYAIGTYVATKDVIGVSEGGFNQSKVAALHGVTPVEWVNAGAGYVTIEVTGIGNIVLGPGGSYTTTFPSPGQYSYAIYNTSIAGRVTVS